MTSDITRMLGSEGAAALLSRVYAQLHEFARARMAGERKDHTLRATALVNEAYLRLVGDQEVAWANRAHFFHAAPEAMRRILIKRRASGSVRIPMHKPPEHRQPQDPQVKPQRPMPHIEKVILQPLP